MALLIQKVQKKLPEYRYILNLYTQSFPKEERIPLFLLKWGSKSKNVDFLAFYDAENANQFVGFIYLLHYKNLSYLCFFAVDTKMRGCGYGSKILHWIKQRYNKQTILLAIEEVDAQYSNFQERIKRQTFYLKNDFVSTNLIMLERKVRYNLMLFGREQTNKAYKKLFKRYASGFIAIRLLNSAGKRI